MNRMQTATEQAFERDLECRRRTRRRKIDQLVEEARRSGGVTDRLYWTMVYDFELAPVTTNLRQLGALGIEVPPAGELDGAGLSDRLWAVIHGLARLQIYLLDTEHLDDRSLYRQLEEQVLREEVREVPPEPGVREYIDLGPRPDSTADSRSEGGSGRSMPGQGRDALLPRPPA